MRTQDSSLSCRRNWHRCDG